MLYKEHFYLLHIHNKRTRKTKKGEERERERENETERRGNRNPLGSAFSSLPCRTIIHHYLDPVLSLSYFTYTYIHIEKCATQIQTTRIQWQETALRYSACILVKKKVGWGKRKESEKERAGGERQKLL